MSSNQKPSSPSAPSQRRQPQSLDPEKKLPNQLYRRAIVAALND
eukprot:CAMPEP_0198150146 /NCGR_PEP_ID=MMETSP1443-20131203/49646_1 /TAXON_ID=186043 /ORGANISM="Entomoneis sp., Strain CCMP2396" /LENGTH=43 /DNA_ID= /DNA_START= /DNA_END= /DNA_ORIENTATION=